MARSRSSRLRRQSERRTKALLPSEKETAPADSETKTDDEGKKKPEDVTTCGDQPESAEKANRLGW
ncbi:swr complex subunit [Metarhizium acridum]|nr:swr complex subunit [Metarhizium acridum]